VSSYRARSGENVDHRWSQIVVQREELNKVGDVVHAGAGIGAYGSAIATASKLLESRVEQSDNCHSANMRYGDH
jgi:hypothetical protein